VSEEGELRKKNSRKGSKKNSGEEDIRSLWQRPPIPHGEIRKKGNGDFLKTWKKRGFAQKIQGFLAKRVRRRPSRGKGKKNVAPLARLGLTGVQRESYSAEELEEKRGNL